VVASDRQYTGQTTCRWHPIATGVAGHIEVLKTAGGSESVSTLSRPEWPSWPFSPSACVQESSELLPATAPRAARGRTNARESVSCIGLATRGLAPRLLASPGDRGGEMLPRAVIGWGQESPLSVPPPCPLKQQVGYRGSIRLTNALN
jgi:hypothetical protein